MKQSIVIKVSEQEGNNIVDAQAKARQNGLPWQGCASSAARSSRSTESGGL